jgi:hypothetical protein
VADRLGQLFNKDALIACMLSRAEAFSHVRSLRRDTSAEVKLSSDGTLQCVLTREPALPDGRFRLGWACGCVTSAAAAAAVAGDGETHNDDDEGPCVACGTVGRKVKLGMIREEREKVLAAITEARRAKESLKKQGRKRRTVDNGDEEARNGEGEAAVAERKRVRQTQSTATGVLDDTVYKSLFITGDEGASR